MSIRSPGPTEVGAGLGTGLVGAGVDGAGRPGVAGADGFGVDDALGAAGLGAGVGAANAVGTMTELRTAVASNP